MKDIRQNKQALEGMLENIQDVKQGQQVIWKECLLDGDKECGERSKGIIDKCDGMIKDINKLLKNLEE